MLDNLLDQLIEGGCDDCQAVQRLTTDEPGIYVLTVEHDDTCPYLLRYTREGS